MGRLDDVLWFSGSRVRKGHVGFFWERLPDQMKTLLHDLQLFFLRFFTSRSHRSKPQVIVGFAKTRGVPAHIGRDFGLLTCLCCVPSSLEVFKLPVSA